ncbi:hypothetical protein QBC40DRAFT_254574 [Triangularia verruculosa]|uniref:Uncharacterized protein n=1 Tax=Triangularia verruculosa TaxID=2587418 RepID=A0AAN6XG75_9PEZI|nr:hypothetical protein QBC40DRAFT_254574 [Triangularia verruculosa]
MQLTTLLTTLTLLASPAFTLHIPNESTEDRLPSSNKVKITETSLDGTYAGSNPIKAPRDRVTTNNPESKHHMISSPKANKKRETCRYSSCDACHKEDNACKICNEELDNLGPCIICEGNCKDTCCR